MTMVRFDDFDIGVIAHHLRRFFQQLEYQIDAHTKVRGKHDPDVGTGIGNRLLTISIKTSGPDHHMFAVLTAISQMGQGGGRYGKVDQDIEITADSIQ